MKSLLRIVLGLIALGGLFVVWNWTYFYRIVTYPFDTPITASQWYEPQDVIEGSPTPMTFRLKQRENAISKKKLAEILTWAEQRNSTALLVLHQGSIVVEKYWRGATAQSTTDSASMGKTITALLIGQSIADGYLRSVNEPLSRFFPEWKNDERGKIKVKNLLQMTSGLVFEEKSKSLFSDITWLHLGTNIIPFVLSKPEVHFEAGTRFQYLSLNFQLLGIIIERVTKTRFSKYLSERIWKPLGASDAGIWLDQKEGMAKTYCCFFVKARDWALLGLLLLNKGVMGKTRIISEKWISEMLTPSTVERNYGYGIWLASNGVGYRKKHHSAFNYLDMFYIDGRAKQRVYVIPSQQLVIVRIGEESVEPDAELSGKASEKWPNGWNDAFLPNTIGAALLAI